MNQFGLAVTVKTLIMLPNESRSSLTSGGGTLRWLSIDIALDLPHTALGPWPDPTSGGIRGRDHASLQAIGGNVMPRLGEEAARRLATRPPPDDIDLMVAPAPRIPRDREWSRVKTHQPPQRMRCRPRR